MTNVSSDEIIDISKHLNTLRLENSLKFRQGSRQGNSGNRLELKVLTLLHYVPWAFIHCLLPNSALNLLSWLTKQSYWWHQLSSLGHRSNRKATDSPAAHRPVGNKRSPLSPRESFQHGHLPIPERTKVGIPGATSNMAPGDRCLKTNSTSPKCTTFNWLLFSSHIVHCHGHSYLMPKFNCRFETFSKIHIPNESSISFSEYFWIGNLIIFKPS